MSLGIPEETLLPEISYDDDDMTFRAKVIEMFDILMGKRGKSDLDAVVRVRDMFEKGTWTYDGNDAEALKLQGRFPLAANPTQVLLQARADSMTQGPTALTGSYTTLADVGLLNDRDRFTRRGEIIAGVTHETSETTTVEFQVVDNNGTVYGTQSSNLTGQTTIIRGLDANDTLPSMGLLLQGRKTGADDIDVYTAYLRYFEFSQ